MAHVSLRKIVLASAVAGVIALMSLGTVGCAPKTADLSETGSGSQAEADENAAMTGDFAFSADTDCTTCHSTEGDSLGDATMPASNHATQECTTCHSDIDSLATAHDGVQFGDQDAQTAEKTTIDTTACFSSGCPRQPGGSGRQDRILRRSHRHQRHRGKPPRPARERGSRDHRLRQLPQHALRRRCRGHRKEGLQGLPPHGRLRVQHLPRVAFATIYLPRFRLDPVNPSLSGVQVRPIPTLASSASKRMA